MALSQRGEKFAMMEAQKQASEAKDPLEQLRAQCKVRGSTGIRGLGRLVFKVFEQN